MDYNKLKKKHDLLLKYVMLDLDKSSECVLEIEQKPILDPVEDYKDYYKETTKTINNNNNNNLPVCEFIFNRHSFSFNYIHEIDWTFVKSAVDRNNLNSENMLPFINSLSTIDRAKVGVGTQLTNTENYKIFTRYAGWEYDKVKEQVLNSGVDLESDLSLSLHFGKLSKYDVDGLAKAIIDTFANYFLGGDDNNIVELHLTAEDVLTQNDGFVKFTIKNVLPKNK
jgi:Holliday junction resolvase RusA-like endonuclease